MNETESKRSADIGAYDFEQIGINQGMITYK